MHYTGYPSNVCFILIQLMCQPQIIAYIYDTISNHSFLYKGPVCQLTEQITT